MAYNKKKIKAEYDAFIKQYGRKKGKNGGDPNDRNYDRKLEEKITNIFLTTDFEGGRHALRVAKLGGMPHDFK